MCVMLTIKKKIVKYLQSDILNTMEHTQIVNANWKTQDVTSNN